MAVWARVWRSYSIFQTHLWYRAECVFNCVVGKLIDMEVIQTKCIHETRHRMQQYKISCNRYRFYTSYGNRTTRAHYTCFTEWETCTHVARPLVFLIWIGISLAKGLISCNCHISGNRRKSNIETVLCSWVRFPKMCFPQRVGQIISPNGFGVLVVMLALCLPG